MGRNWDLGKGRCVYSDRRIVRGEGKKCAGIVNGMGKRERKERVK